MIALEAALSLAWRHWKLILAGGIGLFLAVALFQARSGAKAAHEALTAEKASHALDIANFRAASARAIADNLADVRAKESDAAAITEKTQHDLQAQLADARALAADYARRVRSASAADSGSAGKTSIGETPGPSGHPFGAGGMPLMDETDLRVCTDAVVKARGWQAWYASLASRYNAEKP